MKKNRDIPYCEYRKAILIADELATQGKAREGKETNTDDGFRECGGLYE